LFRERDEDEEKIKKKKVTKERQQRQKKKEDFDEDDEGAGWEEVKKSTHSAVCHFKLFFYIKKKHHSCLLNLFDSGEDQSFICQRYGDKPRCDTEEAP
jgi:hypothetical protein